MPALERAWVDGCFDLTHFGHFNALRQAKAMTKYLVVGVHSDAEILNNKGPTVLTQEERYAMVEQCKWVNQVVRDAPYLTTVETLDAYDCGVCIHGDDITTMADGSDCYGKVKAAGRYKECKRTEGVSTTDIVGRMLLYTNSTIPSTSGQRTAEPAVIGASQSNTEVDDDLVDVASLNVEQIISFAEAVENGRSAVPVSLWQPRTSMLTPLTSTSAPRPDETTLTDVMYVDGDWDLFHAGHVEFLKTAKSKTKHLIVGIHADRVVRTVKGSELPIMKLHERILSVLGCRYVDEVIIGAPYAITQGLLDALPAANLKVAHGNIAVLPDPRTQKDPYSLVKEKDRFILIEHPKTNVQLSTEVVLDRIVKNRAAYEQRQRAKQLKAAKEKEMQGH